MARDLFIAGAFSFVAAMAPLAAILAPRDGTPVMVIGFPWASTGEALRIVASAQGMPLAAPRGQVVIARADAPGFATRLYAAGAALVIDAGAAAGCLGLAPHASISTPRGNQ
jgi:hypothetical protein